jgi:hypothetical protein
MKDALLAKPSIDLQRTARSQRAGFDPAPRSAPRRVPPGGSACACGGACPRCALSAASTPALAIQRKPAISAPGDACEREADAVADTVVGMAEPAPGAVQRQAASAVIQPKQRPSAADAAGLDASTAVDVAAQGGTPLPDTVRSWFEPRFGHDFSQVRVHADDAAANAARGVEARAYTSGSNIVFGAGEYAPTTAQGRRLLAHELTHVVQQGAAGAATGSRVDREPTPEKDVCSKRGPLYGWDNIRNLSRERLRAAGFVFCGPDREYGDPALWEKWVHPTKGVLHFKVKWADEPAPAPAPEPKPAPDKPDDRQQRCGEPCMDKSDDEESCKACCEETIPEDDAPCRRTCDVACSMKL